MLKRLFDSILWSAIIFFGINILTFFYTNSYNVENVHASSSRISRVTYFPKLFNHKYDRRDHYNSNVIKNRDYGFYNNYESDVHTSTPSNYYYTVAGNNRVSFDHPMYLHYTKHVRYNYGYPHGDPQSMTILPNGNLYVLFNAGHDDSHLNRIFKYDVRNGHLLKAGNIFRGGHGQGLSYDYKTKVLWMCMNRYRYHNCPRGILAGDLILSRINQNSLLPYGHRRYVRSNYALGENFSYDQLGDYWNVARSYNSHLYSPQGSLRIYEGKNDKLRLVCDLLHSPSACIQNLCYNPGTNRLYVVGNGCILDFPIGHINHLKNSEVHVTILNRHSEFEGMGFWKSRVYLLVHPDRILRSDKEF